MSSLAVRLEDLISFSATSVAPPATMDRRPHTRKMTRVETGLDRVATYLDGTPDRIELNQCQEELSDYKRDLAALYEDLVTRDIADDDELFRQHAFLERKLSGVSQKLKGMLTPSTTTAPTSSIEGLSHSGDNYEEAVKCLKARSRLIQRTHVQSIVDAPPLKDGSGKELRKLHDIL